MHSEAKTYPSLTDDFLLQISSFDDQDFDRLHQFPARVKYLTVHFAFNTRILFARLCHHGLDKEVSTMLPEPCVPTYLKLSDGSVDSFVSRLQFFFDQITQLFFADIGHLRTDSTT